MKEDAGAREKGTVCDRDRRDRQPGAARSLQASFRAMSLFLMIQQYENELARIRGQIRSMEQTGEADTDRRKYRQLKQIRSELQSSIRQMKQYTKKG